MNIKLYAVLVSLLLLAGCAKYKARGLKPIRVKRVEGFEKENLFIGCSAFDREESVAYLGKDLLKAGYQPIQIAIENGTARYLSFAQEDLNLKTMPAALVAETVYDKTTNRIVGWGISSLFFPLFLIPTIVDSSWSVEANQKLMADYMAKAMPNKLIVPSSRLEGLVFVSLNDFYKEELSVVLVDRDTQEKIVCTTEL